MRKRVLVLGIGNILLRDEGVGVRVIEALRGMPVPDRAELLDGGTGGADLLDCIADRELLVVVDAMDAGAPAGSVRRLGLDELRGADGPNLSIHEFGLLDTLRAARQLGCAPREVAVIGVQPRFATPGLALSPEVEGAVPVAAHAVLAELRRRGRRSE